MKKGICYIMVCLLFLAGCSQQVFVTQPEDRAYFADYTIALTGETGGMPADLTVKMCMLVSPVAEKEQLYQGQIEEVSLKSNAFPFTFDSKTGLSGTKLDVLAGQTLYFTIAEGGTEISGYDKITEAAAKIENSGDLLKAVQNMMFDLFFSRESFLNYFSFFSNSLADKEFEKGDAWEKQIWVCNPVPYTANARYTYQGITEDKHSISMELPQTQCADFSMGQNEASILFSDITVSGSGKYIQNQGNTLTQSDASDQNFTGELVVAIPGWEIYRGPAHFSVKSSFIVTEKLPAT